MPRLWQADRSEWCIVMTHHPHVSKPEGVANASARRRYRNWPALPPGAGMTLAKLKRHLGVEHSVAAAVLHLWRPTGIALALHPRVAAPLFHAAAEAGWHVPLRLRFARIARAWDGASEAERSAFVAVLHHLREGARDARNR